MEFECKNLTTLGCERMDAVKELILLEQIENNVELDLKNIQIQQKNLRKKKLSRQNIRNLVSSRGVIRTILSKVNEIVNRAKEIMEAKGTSPLASVIKAIEEVERELEEEQWKK